MESVTLRQLAERAGLGKSTVQRALANHPKVKAETRAQVQVLAAELGYVPDAYFSQLSARKRQSKHGGLPIAYLHDGTKTGIFKLARGADLGVAELNREARAMGYEVRKWNPRDFENPQALLKMLWSRGAVGILVGNVSAGMAAALRAFGRLPVVALFRDPELPFHTIRFSVATAVRQCWERLDAKGYRRIGCAVMRHEPALPDDRDRLGAALALVEGQRPPSERIPPLAALIGDGVAFRRWLKQHRPEAVIGFNAGLYFECRTSKGRDIPFVTLHAKHGNEVDFVPGAHEPGERVRYHALRQIDTLIRSGECGVPASPYDLVIHTEWHDGG